MAFEFQLYRLQKGDWIGAPRLADGKPATLDPNRNLAKIFGIVGIAAFGRDGDEGPAQTWASRNGFDFSNPSQRKKFGEAHNALQVSDRFIVFSGDSEVFLPAFNTARPTAEQAAAKDQAARLLQKAADAKAALDKATRLAAQNKEAAKNKVQAAAQAQAADVAHQQAAAVAAQTQAAADAAAKEANKSVTDLNTTIADEKTAADANDTVAPTVPGGLIDPIQGGGLSFASIALYAAGAYVLWKVIKKGVA